MTAVVIAALLGFTATVALLLRSLKIAQLEHYIPGSVATTLRRWFAVLPVNWALLIIAIAAIVAALVLTSTVAAAVVLIVGAIALIACPFPLSRRGLEGKAKFTRRLTVVTLVAALLVILLALVLWALPGVGLPVALVTTALATPLLVDVALMITSPIEAVLAEKFAVAAAEALRRVNPTTVAITGSFGKTTTKEYLATMLSGVRATVPSPASFNNKAGLSRAVSEKLEPGTEVFVAEMGTYGRGEIAALCRYFPPDVSVFCAVGPVHLERMKTIDGIVEAKSEIFQPGKPAVINVDYPELAALAERMVAQGSSRVIRVTSTGVTPADVSVRTSSAGFEITSGGTTYRAEHPDPASLDGANLASALGAVVALGLPIGAVTGNIARIERPKNRRVAGVVPGGWTVIDDTFNSNPAGARAAVRELARRTPHGTKVVVTPGMVELGAQQAAANERWMAESAGYVDRLIVVGRTNRAALLKGASAAGIATETVERREDAVVALRTQLRDGDGVLYENDLPIHYP